MAESGSAIQTALTTAFASVQSDVISTITASLPYALGIMAVALSITIAIKLFKRFSKA